MRRTAPQMTRVQYLEMTQRTYEGKTPDDVFAAAERLFRLTGGDDFQFSEVRIQRQDSKAFQNI